MHGLRSGLIASFLLLISTGGLASQEGSSERDILESQRRLEEIRRERTLLQEEMTDLRTRADGASTALRNIERQLSASRSVLSEIDFQIDARSADRDETTEALQVAQVQLVAARETLVHRLRGIYKQGPLHTVRVLLSAQSFSNLLSRYRYLHLLAAQDRSLMDRVLGLERELTFRNRELQESLAELHRLREDKEDEVVGLERVENQRQLTLARYRSEVAATESRLAQLTQDEERLSGLIGDIEEDRVLADRRARVSGAAPAAESGGGTGGRPALAELAGTLDWPVTGPLVYEFGRQRQPNGTVLRWNGVGIGAPAGTPVQAVLEGTVALAGPFEGYGPTVVLSHGDGLYTLYLYLEEIGVVQGRTVQKGQVVGTVGGVDTPEGPHIEFQIRSPVAGAAVQALNPLEWLKSGGGT